MPNDHYSLKDMTLTIEPIAPVERISFAAEVSGIDLTRRLADAEVAAIHVAIDRYGVLVFHDQALEDEQQIEFSRQLGALEQATGDIGDPRDRRVGLELNDISNLDRHGELLPRDDRRRLFGLGNQLWHSDSSFKEIPAKYSMLSARRIPPTGGNTEFADMRAAYDALDEKTRDEIHDLICSHSQIFSRGVLGFDDFTAAEREKWAPVRQRLVRRHPTTGRLSLYLSSHAGAIEGWPVPEARAFLRELTEHATQRQFVYAHVWKPWDLVMWDNRVTMHRADHGHFLEERILHRGMVRGETPEFAQ